MDRLKLKVISNLSRVLPEGYDGEELKSFSIFLGEQYSCILAVYNADKEVLSAHIGCIGLDEERVLIRRMKYVPLIKNTRFCGDDYFCEGGSTVYADILEGVDITSVELLPRSWTYLHITIKGGHAVGHRMVELWAQEGASRASVSVGVDLIAVELPRTDIMISNWIHFDCISSAHGKAVFSKEYYLIVEKYIKSAVELGSNMILTPLFTFPLDTAQGAERSTFQLVEIEVMPNGRYSFDLTGVEKFMSICFELGVDYIEFSHLFTQWGATHCPKIMASKEGKLTQIFGWESQAQGAEYVEFLRQFLPELVALIDRKGLRERCFFHISDEPSLEHRDTYASHRQLLKEFIGDMKVLEAISSPGYLEYVDLPIASTDLAQQYLAADKPVMVYYCCMQNHSYLSNRCMDMSHQRNRILGFQLYFNNAAGFLHWGFNFYYSYKSKGVINPYVTNDAGGYFPPGDSFIVYPHGDGVLESPRLAVFRDAVQDYRALKLLESVYGRDYVMALLTAEGLKGFGQYPRSAKWHLDFREKINRLIVTKQSDGKRRT